MCPVSGITDQNQGPKEQLEDWVQDEVEATQCGRQSWSLGGEPLTS